jgi:hypothetical protein
MLAVFSLRLAAGMIGCLVCLPARLLNPRFYRTHFLTALGLTVLAWLFLAHPADWLLTAALAASAVLAFAGSFVWSLEGAPAGLTVVGLTALALATALGLSETEPPVGAASRAAPEASRAGTDVSASSASGAASRAASTLDALVAGFTSAALLGTVLTAMLVGHSYLIAPSMSLTPLLRLLAMLGGAVMLRALADGFALYRWTGEHPWSKLGNDVLLWLPVRWLVGLVAPLILGWMAWQTARIRSTQSATGILYVVVIFSFLGELTSQLLRETGITL